MKTLVPGHEYILQSFGGLKECRITFVDKGHGNDRPGTNTQELLRVAIDRVTSMDKELPWDGNNKILFHLRAALVLFEARHLERLVERGELDPEKVATGLDGHFSLSI